MIRLSVEPVSNPHETDLWFQFRLINLFKIIVMIVFTLILSATTGAWAQTTGYDAKAIGEDWDNNSVVAGRKYKGKSFTIGGDIRKIEISNRKHHAYMIVLEGNSPLNHVRVYADGPVEHLRKGQYITITCNNFKTDIEFRCNIPD